MSYEAVNIYLTTPNPRPVPIPGAVVKVYDATGTTFIAMATTDSGGMAAFLLPSGLTYQVRFYKAQVGFPNPLYITVQPSPAQNGFTVVGQVFVRPVASDIRLCRVSGFFRTITGAAGSFVSLEFLNTFSPILLDGAAVLSENRTIRTDIKGYAEIDLIRGAIYDVVVKGLEDMTRTINVPDSPSWNLPDLLLAVVDSVLLPPGPYGVWVNGTTVLPITTYGTDGQILTQSNDVLYYSDNTDVLTVGGSDVALTLNGVKAGTANVTAVRADTSIIRIPNTPIGGFPIAVTVSL